MLFIFVTLLATMRVSEADGDFNYLDHNSDEPLYDYIAEYYDDNMVNNAKFNRATRNSKASGPPVQVIFENQADIPVHIQCGPGPKKRSVYRPNEVFILNPYSGQTVYNVPSTQSSLKCTLALDTKLMVFEAYNKAKSPKGPINLTINSIGVTKNGVFQSLWS